MATTSGYEMSSCYNYLVAINITLSYIMWVIVSTVFYNRLKRLDIYVLFPTVLYTIPTAYFAVKGDVLVPMGAIVLSFLMLLTFMVTLGKKPVKLVLIPLPLILCIVYELLVNCV